MTGLSSNNPFPRSECSRQDCPLAVAGTPCREQCHTEGLVYAADCLTCEREGKPRSTYIGESSRTLFVRTGQHRKDFHKATRVGEDLEHSSWMWDHQREAHPSAENQDPVQDYKFYIIGRHRDPLTRQLEEAIRITRALDSGQAPDMRGNLQPTNCLNRRGESFAPRVRWNPEGEI